MYQAGGVPACIYLSNCIAEIQMKLKHIFFICTVTLSVSAHAALTFDGLSLPVVETDPDRASGMECVYMISTENDVRINYAAETQDVTWYRYGGPGTEMVPVDDVVKNGNTYSIAASQSDEGYVIWDGTKQYYYWVANYENHPLTLNSITVSEESACDRATLVVDGVGERITYYAVNGRGFELSRDLSLTYRTLEFDAETKAWKEKSVTDVQASLHAMTTVDAPLCDTEFVLTGDRFLQAWGRAQTVQTVPYTAQAVRAETTADQAKRDGDNEMKPDMGALGGSAPCVITFTAYPSDAAVFHEWQFSRTEEFEDIYQSFAQDELEYTFDEQGTVYVRYQCGDAAGVCFYESPVYAVSVGESKLECPNAFSPFNEDGINDLWKVSYQSLISFECNIFNRWGIKVATLSDPSQGWDGKHNGKFVPAGVYYYVIKATGADGVKYNRSGDINILKSRLSGTSSTNPE